MDRENTVKQLLLKLKIPKPEKVIEEEDELEEGEIREEDDYIGTGLKEVESTSLNTSINRDNIRVCRECFKEFSSGKALGGHMRIHSPQQSNLHNDNNINKLKQNVRDKRTQINNQKVIRECIDEKGLPVCKICGKNFPSFKSLFGHMRCHPEREWRGIVPPDHDQSSLFVHNINDSKSYSSSSLSITDDLNLSDKEDVSAGSDAFIMDMLSMIPRRKRTGRLPVGIISKEKDAADDLIRLRNGDHHTPESSSTHKEQMVDKFEVTNSNSLTSKGDSGIKTKSFDEEASNDSRSKKRKYDEESKREDMLEISNNNGSYKNCSDNELSMSNEYQLALISNNSENTTPNRMKKRKKMKSMMDLESGVDDSSTTTSQAHKNLAVEGTTLPDNKYKCNKCNRSFSTHQALGGHKSSHNKFKINILNAVVEKKDDDGNNRTNKNGVKLDESVKGTSGGSTHQCTICNEVFPTGQALGGHKRRHWTGPPADQAGPSLNQVTSSTEEASQTAVEGPMRILNFDQVGLPSNQVTSSHEEASQTAVEGAMRILNFDQAGLPSNQVTSSPEEASQTAVEGRMWVANFDLNEVPQMEDEGGDNGNGYTSSSYTSKIG